MVAIMTDQDKELRMRISMLMDSDLDARDNPRLIGRLEEDAELQATWARYSLIGDVMRAPGAPLADKDFAAKISDLLADEPTVLAPKALKTQMTARPSIVSLALAASLLVVAVLVGKSVNDHTDVFQMASHGKVPSNQVAINGAQSVENQADSQFNDYLAMHSETAYMAGSAGMLPYVRVVGSRSDR
jgi:sigma-E factor negative regulatory protein RseA